MAGNSNNTHDTNNTDNANNTNNTGNTNNTNNTNSTNNTNNTYNTNNTLGGAPATTPTLEINGGVWPKVSKSADYMSQYLSTECATTKSATLAMNAHQWPEA